MIERIVYEQTNKCFSENNILYNFQSGFRQNHSTDKILKEFDEGLLTGIILIDLQKAFGTTNHEVLLQKRKAIRSSEQSIKWFGLGTTFVTKFFW